MVLSLFNLCHDNVDDNNLDSNLEDLIIPAVSMGLEKEYTHISGHCDGILCIFDLRDNVILCNPSIKEFKLLPESQLVLSSQDDFSKVYVGFGYDLISKSYKVVRIISYGRDCGEGGYIFIIPPKAEVYTLGTHSWREIETHNMVTNNTIVWPIELAYCPFFFMFCKGMVYWIAFEQKKKCHMDDDSIIKQVILSFDMSDEVFHVITCPAGSGIEEILDFDYKMLTVWNNDTIALSVCRNRHYASSYDIWVIEEYNVDVGSNGGAAANKEYSWTKCLTFEPVDVGYVERTMAVGRDSHDRFLLVAKNECVVIFYDVSTDKYMHLPINSIFIRQALFYVNSIVSINGGNYILDKGD